MKVITTAADLDTKRPPGLYPVAKAAGLYLQVSGTGTKSWVCRYRLAGERRAMGLGPASRVSLADARKAATAATALRDRGVDPIDARRAEKTERAAASRNARPAKTRKPDRSNTFKSRAERFIDVQSQGWKRKNAHTLWRNPFAKWVYPVIGDMEIGDIRLSHVVTALSVAWSEVPETARRMRARIERVFDAAIADGAYERANPAAARLVATQLPNKRRIVQHFRAAKLEDAPALYQRIAEAQGTAYRALQFMILTTARPSEALQARWSEVDRDNKVWTVPADRTKANRAHVVPLSDPAMAVLEAQARLRVGDCVFPGQRPDAPLSYDPFATALRKIAPVSPHSFRSTFRDWAGDFGDVPRDVAEAQLAHALGPTEGAYRRRSAVEKRRIALAAYAKWLGDDEATVVIAFPTKGG